LQLTRPDQVIQRQGVRPAITQESKPYWDAAARGELAVEQCPDCGLHIFPPRDICRRCYRRGLIWTVVQPPGVLVSATVNHNQWTADAESVYGIGLVEFPEYSSIRFVGFLDGFDDPPRIGSLVDFAFAPTGKKIHRVYFTLWTQS
jgi:uncharacterized OB-fold protein